MESTYKNVLAITASDSAQWRKWLKENHAKMNSVWLIIYKKGSGQASVYYSEAVDDALCYGWIDSKPNKRDANSYYQYFAKRSAKSNWSKVNKDKVQRLIASKKMRKPGYDLINVAKKTGTWDALNDVDNLIKPIDLQEAFQQNTTASQNWENFPRSVKRGILEWIFNAKRSETRQKRITTTVEMAAQNKRAIYDQ